MDADQLRCLARVRVLALRAMISAGGEPRPGQLARAFAPLAELDEADRLRALAREGTVVSEEVPPWKRGRKRSRVVRVF